jgi:hypothetical protein
MQEEAVYIFHTELFYSRYLKISIKIKIYNFH